jgi:hypothetical protein
VGKMTDQEIQGNFNHIGSRIDDFANHLQTAMNPIIDVSNGDPKKMLQSDAIAELWLDRHEVHKKLDLLDDRTMVLADIQKTVDSYRDLKKRLKRLLLPIGRGIVDLACVGAIAYAGYQIFLLIIGKITIIDIWNSLKTLVEFII